MSTILPYIQDTTPTPGLSSESSNSEVTSRPKMAGKRAKTQLTRTNSGITSLSYDEVNNDADELVELRGEGRYFGVTDLALGDTINANQSLGVLCGNCHQHGHHRRSCKTVVCHKCGAVGEHYEQHCPQTVVCSRCSGKGHSLFLCLQKDYKRQYCKLCDNFTHADERCPSIWRLYLTRPSAVRLSVPSSVACYNCGSTQHYGDECNLPRASRVPNQGSAFSGSNLPRELRASYFDRVLRAPRPTAQIPPPARNFNSSYNNNNNMNHSINSNVNNNMNSSHYRGSNRSTNSAPLRSNGYGRPVFSPSNILARQALQNLLGSHAIGSRGQLQKAKSGHVAKPTRLGLVDSRKGRNLPRVGSYNISRMY